MRDLTKVLKTLQVLRKLFVDESMPDFVRLVDSGAVALIYRSNVDLSSVPSSVEDEDPQFMRLFNACLLQTQNCDVCAKVVRYWFQKVTSKTSKKSVGNTTLTFLENPILAGLKSIQRLNITQEIRK